MNNLLKAMLKGNKHDAYTQVDEGELVWKPNLIMPSHENDIQVPSIDLVETTALNLDAKIN